MCCDCAACHACAAYNVHISPAERHTDTLAAERLLSGVYVKVTFTKTGQDNRHSDGSFVLLSRKRHLSLGFEKALHDRKLTLHGRKLTVMCIWQCRVCFRQRYPRPVSNHTCPMFPSSENPTFVARLAGRWLTCWLNLPAVLRVTRVDRQIVIINL